MSGYSFLRIEKNKKKKFIPLNEGEAKKNEQNSEERNDLRKVFR